MPSGVATGGPWGRPRPPLTLGKGEAAPHFWPELPLKVPSLSKPRALSLAPTPILMRPEPENMWGRPCK